MNIKDGALIYFKGLVGARKKEIETEDHLKKIAEREEGRLEQEIQRLQNEMDELKERKNIYEVDNRNFFVQNFSKILQRKG